MPRLIHDIDESAQVGGGARRYVKPLSAPFASGMHADLVITVGETDPPEELLYIEGDARHVLKALRDAVAIIERCGEMWVEDGTLDPEWQAEKKMKKSGKKKAK